MCPFGALGLPQTLNSRGHQNSEVRCTYRVMLDRSGSDIHLRAFKDRQGIDTHRQLKQEPLKQSMAEGLIVHEENKFSRHALEMPFCSLLEALKGWVTREKKATRENQGHGGE